MTEQRASANDTGFPAKTIEDLTHECCELSCLAGGLELLILNAGVGNDTAMAARDAAHPLCGIVAARLDALHNDLAAVKGGGSIAVPTEAEAAAA